MKNAAPLVALAALGALFAARLAAGPHLFDAGELVAATWQLGGSHPPGQPLHALAAHIFARLPLGPIPARVALFSGACVLWAAWLSGRIARELGAYLQAPAAIMPWVETAAIVGVGLTGPVLRQALRVEVYGLSLALSLLSMLHLIRWALGGPGRHIVFAGFAAGLAAGGHPLHALAAVLVGLALALPQASRLLRRPAPVLWAALFALMGLVVVYAYLPARGMAGAPMWGQPTELAGLFDYVTGKAYAQNWATGEQASWLARIGALSVHALVTGAGVGVLALLVLLLLAPARRALITSVLVACALAMVPSWPAFLDVRIPDHPGYFAPACALMIAAGCAALGALWTAGRMRAVALGGLCLIAASPYTLAHAAEYTSSDAPVLETLMGTFTEAPPPRALVVPTTDFPAAGWMMARVVDGARPDVAVFIAGLSTSSWQWDAMARHPGLAGKPQRGPGRDAHRQYLRGAIQAALPHVAVALERDVSGLQVSAMSGPYALLARPQPGAPAGLLSRSIAERLQPLLTREAMAGPAGDSGAVDAIMRDQLSQRGRRLLGAGQTRAGLHALTDSLWPLSANARERILPPDDQITERPSAVPRVIEDASSYLLSRGEAVRTLAAALWAAGLRERGMRLLEDQARGGEPRALLQLAWLQLYDGQPDAARTTLDGLLAAAPELSDESRPLAAMLARIAARP